MKYQLFTLLVVGSSCMFVLHMKPRILAGNNTAAQYKIHNLPPIDTLIDSTNTTIIGDISFLLDFAIIGFPKAGTTFLKDYIPKGTSGGSDSDDREVYLYPHELCMKRTSAVIDFVYKFYELHLQYNQQYEIKRPVKFGIKCPGVLYRPHDILYYKKYFPHAKLIIGLRHPISWFESFYNYQSWRNITMPMNTTQLIGRCNKHRKVCTDRARLHAALARLGKTELVEDEELSLLYGFDISKNTTVSSEEDNVGSTTSSSTQQLHGRKLTNDDQRVQPRSRHQQQRGISNELLLYEINQILNSQTSTAFSKSIQQYLNIQHDLPQIKPYNQTKVRAINICDTQHDNVRKVLLEHGKHASKWIQTYFLSNPSVNVVDETSFYKLLNDWNVDPCS